MESIPRGLYMCLECALHDLIGQPMQASRQSRVDNGPLYTMEDGIATIPITGLMMQNESWFTGTSTVKATQAFMDAANNSDVRAIFAPVNSPGGQAMGNGELHDAIAYAAKAKPVHAHIGGYGASAAYYAMAPMSRITASRDSEIGSIGTIAVIEDASGMAAQMGVRVIVLKSGANKGGPVFGAPVTDEMIAVEQEILDDFNQLFVDAVRKGRKMNKAQMEEIASGRTWIAQKAQDLGLIDGVMNRDQAYAQLVKAAKPAPSPQTSRRDRANLRMVENRLTR